MSVCHLVFVMSVPQTVTVTSVHYKNGKTFSDSHGYKKKDSLMFMTRHVYVHSTLSYRTRRLRGLPWASPALELENRNQVYFSARVVSRGERYVPLPSLQSLHFSIPSQVT